jgi:putative ABC transport system ATP-binding protein
VQDLSFDAAPGSLTVMLGPSGCGKTSVLACVAGLLRPTGGSVFVDDSDIATLDRDGLAGYRGGRVGIVFQAFNLVPSLTALENVLVPLAAARVPRAEARSRAAAILERVDLGDRLRHKPNQLSGGQMQRVAIARALALDPPLVLADEPTANLDQGHVASVVSLLRTLSDQGRCLLVATHDHRVVDAADHVIDLTPR